MNLQQSKIRHNIDHPILKKLPAEIRNEIAQMAEDKVLSSGTTVFSQGDPGDSFFMIKSGSVRIYRKTEDNIETELAVLGPGESFGEMALLTGAQRAATVDVLEDAQLTMLSKDQFDRILKNYPLISLTLIKQMAAWLIDNDRILEQEHSRQFKPPKLNVFDFIIILLLSGLCAVIFNQSNPNGIKLFPKNQLIDKIDTITPSMAAYDLRKGRTHFVDAMPSNFYEQSHIAGAVNVPLAIFDIMYLMGLSDVDKSTKIIVYGRTISKLYDVQLANKLYLRGHKNIYVLYGGLSLWNKKGYPVEP